jgi:AbiV family abortive infection protein
MKSALLFHVASVGRPRSGRLSREEGLAAARAAAAAARGLYEDAVLLYVNGRRARAAALAILALEEVGKLWVLDTIVDAPDEASLRQAWAEYRAHRPKVAKNLRAGPGLDEEQVQDSVGREADTLKQLALYSNHLDGGDWVWPESIVKDEDVALAMELAKYMIGQLPPRLLAPIPAERT